MKLLMIKSLYGEYNLSYKLKRIIFLKIGHILIFSEEFPPSTEPDNLPIDSMNGKVSHVKQYLEEQEKRSREKPNILPNRKQRSSSLDGRDGRNMFPNTPGSKNKELATFSNGKGVSGIRLMICYVRIDGYFNKTFTMKRYLIFVLYHNCIYRNNFHM